MTWSAAIVFLFATGIGLWNLVILLSWHKCGSCGVQMRSARVNDPGGLNLGKNVTLNLLGNIPRKGTQKMKCPQCGRQAQWNRWFV